MEKECKDCKYWSQEKWTPIKGSCHRHSPVPLKIRVVMSDTSESGTGFPPTFDDDWCGDHEQKEKE